MTNATTKTMLALLATMPLLLACESNRAVNQAVDQVQIKVELVIDYRGESKNTAIQHSLSKGSTVLDLLVELQRDTKLDFAHRGSGETAFVYSINEVENENSGGSNWLFLINNSLSDRGCGSQRLVDGDNVKWLFSEEYPPIGD